MKINTMNEMLELQGCNGNWDYDPYMHGIYNGMEFMMSLAEDRDLVFRKAPEEWLYHKQYHLEETPTDKVQ